MQKTLLTAVTITSLLLPRVVIATPSVYIDDTVAGLGTELTIAGGAAGAATATITPPYGPEETLTVSVDTTGNGSVWIPGRSLELAGIYSVTVTQGTVLRGNATFRVYADSVDTLQSSIQADESTFTESTTVRVILRDRFGNSLPGRSVELISSRASDTINPLSRETDSRGEQAFVVTAHNPGTFTVRAIDLLSGKVLSTETQLTSGNIANAVGGYSYGVTPTYTAQKQFYPANTGSPYGASLLGQVTGGQQLGGFLIEIRGQESEAVPTLKLNDFYSMKITALDQRGNLFLDYVGKVYLLSTDPSADLPKDGEINFEFRDQGVKQYTLGLSFHTPNANNTHTMVITDHPSEVRTVLGELDVRITGGTVSQATQDITITTPKTRSILNSNEIEVQGFGPPFINIRVVGGLQTAAGETDLNGDFSVTVELDPDQTEHTLQVLEQGGRSQSQEITVTVDASAPEIKSMTFSPSSPKEETDVLLVVESEANLQSATLTFGDAEFDLTPSTTEPTKYQILFTAPVGGIYNPVVTLTDESGNTTEESTTLAVGLKGLPIVQNVVATSETNAISLSWDPVTNAEIGGYRVYVGTEPGEFIYNLDTDRPTAAATVAGLQPGETYYFAVTALLGERESEEKSEVVSATVFGVDLEVTPQNNALLLEWDSLQRDSPVSFFLLEYGTEPEVYTEQRTLTGELRAYTLRDLLNGVTYYMKLTPVAVTGDRLEELSTTGQGTPTGRLGVFVPGNSDPIPFDVPVHTGAPVTPKPPVNADTGIPLPAWWIAALLAGAGFTLYARKRKQMMVTAAFLQSMESRYHQ